MTQSAVAGPQLVSFDDLKSLAAAKGPCVTIVAPIPNPIGMRIRLKNAIREVKKKLSERGVDSDTIDSLLEPVTGAVAVAEAQRKWANTLILFRSPEVFRYYWLDEASKELLTVADRFQIRPLLSLMSREQQFHILALSKQHTRLFRCTHHSSEEIELRGVAKGNLRAWMNTRTPDHVLDNRAAGGPSVGSMKGVMFGTSTDWERADESLTHFFKEVDKELRSQLREDTAPLILAGVEYELAIYRMVNTYPRLFENVIRGSPDPLAPRELHRKAMEIVMQAFSQPLQRALADLEKQSNAGPAMSTTEIVKAAFEGRVADLLLSEDAEKTGTWNEQTSEIQTRPRAGAAEDLLNAAALQTVLHHGRAFALKPREMPGQAEAAAVLRF